MKNLFYFITATVLLFTAAAFVSPQPSTQNDSSYNLPANLTITGCVKDENGEALIGASILEKGTANGTVTDFDGKYSLAVTDKNAILIISYTGFSTQEIKLGKTNVLDIVMVQGVTLEECIVTAYKAPLIEQDNTTQGRVIPSENIRNVSKVSPSKEARKRPSRAERK